jgi:hypothetical protein
VHAVVSAPSKTRPEIALLVRSRIVLTRQAYETVPGARGVADPLISPDQLLSPANVIASSRVVQTTDLADHALTLTAPAGLAPRDYFVIAVQHATQQCQPSPRTGPSWAVIGLVRVLTRDGRVAVLKPLPSHAK